MPDLNWYADTGATVHLTTDLGILASSIPYLSKDKIYIAGGAGLEVSHTSKTILPTSSANIALQSVLVVP